MKNSIYFLSLIIILSVSHSSFSQINIYGSASNQLLTKVGSDGIGLFHVQ